MKKENTLIKRSKNINKRENKGEYNEKKSSEKVDIHKELEEQFKHSKQMKIKSMRKKIIISKREKHTTEEDEKL